MEHQFKKLKKAAIVLAIFLNLLGSETGANNCPKGNYYAIGTKLIELNCDNYLMPFFVRNVRFAKL